MANTFSPSRSGALLLLLSLTVLASACTTQPLVTPPAIRAATTPQETRIAILRALAESNWILESERQGEIVARYGRSNWTMTVEIAYANEISIRYLDSVNLDYATEKNGKPVIHRGYNFRVQRLARVIGTEVMIAQAASSLPPVATPPPAEAPTE